MAQHRTKESRPRQGEVLIYKPAEGKGEIYGSKEGKTFRFDLKSSPGLNPDLLKPGIAVTYVTVHSDDGTRAVEVQLEEAGSLETRLRSTRKRLGTKASRPAGMQAPSVVIPSLSEAPAEATEATGEGEQEDATGESPVETTGDAVEEGVEAATENSPEEAVEGVEAATENSPEDAAEADSAPEPQAPEAETTETKVPEAEAAEAEPEG